jgi:hypothetical protein
MTRIAWGAPSERYFETGVDRGVLFVNPLIGVPWVGLVSVSESPTGGEAKASYIDGYKFRNISSAEEFAATIEAFAAPKEFDPCDGNLSIQNGLIATQQPRKPFNFSYRTKIGNALEGQNHAYKVHLVYNALAAPSERANNTISDSAEAPTRSWAVSTRPPRLALIRPTAHFVVDSRYTDPTLLQEFENILYGSDAADSRIPPVEELVTLFTP